MTDGQDSETMLTRRQRLILAENRLLPDFPCNVEISRLSVAGRLDHGRLAKAWASVLRRHDCLRARLPASGDIGLEFPDTGPDMTLLELDSDDLEGALRQSCGHPFKAGETLCRAYHLRAPGGDHVIIGQSHLVSDGTTKAMIFKDLGDFYASGKVERDLSSRFEDYLAGAADKADDAVAEGFWAEKLAAPAPVLKLYGSEPRQARGRLETSTIPVDADIAKGLMARPGKRSPSLAMTAVVAALMHRITGEETIAMGVPVANRPDGAADVGGLFMEVVPNRIYVDPAQSLADLAAVISADAREVRPFRHHAVSGAKSGHEVMLNYRPSVVEEFAGMAASQSFLTAPHILEEGTEVAITGGGVGILIEIMRNKDGTPFEIAVHVDVARWPQPGLGARFLTHFEKVLCAMVETPDMAIGAIDLVDEVEARDLILGPDPADPIPDDIPDVWQTIRARSQKTPDSAALRSGDRVLTYREVIDAADRVSAALVDRGIRPGDLVAVCLRRSEQLPLALLGIMGAGATYVPLDPDHAASRIALILEDAAPRLVITAPESSGVLAVTDHQMVLLDDLLNGAGDGIDLPGAGLDGTAYVIFTSGSTGRPKGVRISHRNLASFLLAMTERPGLSSETRLLAVTTVTFDISALEIFGPLVKGGQVVLASEQEARDPRALMALMRDHEVSMLQATPATWRMLIEAGWRDPDLVALCGGEAMSVSLAEALVERTRTLWNMFGPTETTVWSMVAPVKAGGPVVLGTPIRGTSIALRTSEGALVPRGVPGEITIEGAGVAEGYHGRDDLTGERFIGEGVARRYRTGDLARHQSSGNGLTLCYMGRSDHQVKIRGFRIELGEIEAQINSVSGVSNAVVTTVEGALDTKALAAYWSGDNSAETRAAIVSAVVSNLPAYMAPASYTHLEAFPLSPAGKVDRARLPNPVESDLPETGFPSERLRALPQSEAELELVERIGRVLGHESLPVDVPIRDFGLDSLSHLTLSLDLEKTLKGSLPPDWEAMSIRALATIQPAGEDMVSIQMPVFLRALLITDVVAGHFGLFGMSGSIQGLLIVAGHSFGRFLVPACQQRDNVRPILGLVGTIALPTILAVAFLQTFFGQYTPAGWILLSNYIPQDKIGHFNFWFVEVLVQCLVILAVLFSFASVRRWAVERPLETALTFLFMAYLAKHAMDMVWDTHYLYRRVPHHALWLMGLGWCVAVSREGWQRRITIGVSVVLVSVGLFIDESIHIQPSVALALLLAFGRIRLPRRIAQGVMHVAAASLFIYLSHFQFWSIVKKLPDPLNTPWLGLPVALLGGVVCYLVWEKCMQVARSIWARHEPGHVAMQG